MVITLFVSIGYKEIECTTKEKVLVGINGMTQTDSGLLSDSDIHKTTLLFEDGEVITLDKRIRNVFLGQPTKIEQCTTRWFQDTYKIVED